MRDREKKISVISYLVTVDLQSSFRLEIYQNNIIFIFKNYFWYQYIKTVLKNQKN